VPSTTNLDPKHEPTPAGSSARGPLPGAPNPTLGTTQRKDVTATRTVGVRMRAMGPIVFRRPRLPVSAHRTLHGQTCASTSDQPCASTVRRAGGTRLQPRLTSVVRTASSSWAWRFSGGQRKSSSGWAAESFVPSRPFRLAPERTRRPRSPNRPVLTLAACRSFHGEVSAWKQ
jgi:hypothetical protein